MPRETFQQELEEPVGEVEHLGRMVEGSLDNTVEAMEMRDPRLAHQEIGGDLRYKRRGAEIAHESMILQVRQAPVAGDLRLLYTAQTVTNHLVRSGTLAEHICNAIVETAEPERDENLEAVIVEMAQRARDIFRGGLDIFDNRDINHARNLQADVRSHMPTSNGEDQTPPRHF
jgi:phosphate transport system protein